MTDEANAEPTGKILSFPTEQRRVAVATERQDGSLFTPEELSELISQFTDVDMSEIQVSIDNLENSIQYSFDDLADNDFKILPGDANNFFKKSEQSPYTQTLENITKLLVFVHGYNSTGQEGTLDEINREILDLINYLEGKDQ